MPSEFAGWITSQHFYDPIPTERRTSGKFTGRSRAICWEIFETITYLENLNAAQTMVWRGHKSADWHLSTRLQRFWENANPKLNLDGRTFRREQQKVLAEARARGIGFTEHGKTRVNHTYAELQHYGVPTHLLDVTEDALTALWFACQSCKKPRKSGRGASEQDGILFAIDVSKMKSHSTSDLEPSSESNRLIYLKSAVPNKRISAQRAAFIISREPTKRGDSGIENFTTPPLRTFTAKDANAIRSAKVSTGGQPRKIPFVAILIPHESKDWILNKLESGKKHCEETLFPDVLGLAQKYATA